MRIYEVEAKLFPFTVTFILFCMLFFFCLAMNVGISKLALENHDKIAHFVQYGCILCNSSQATMSGFPEHQQIMFA